MLGDRQLQIEFRHGRIDVEGRYRDAVDVGQFVAALGDVLEREHDLEQRIA